MNILFISKLTGNLWAGPNNSVPAQIKAQSKIDNCFWYNLNDVVRDEWQQEGLHCKCKKDFPSGRLKDLPKPFNMPDVAVVEEVYCFPFERIITDLINNNIPYIIIPRSTLTAQAQANKKLKKILGNIIWFNHMINHASGIQYLSVEEQIESEAHWKCSSKVIPNGISIENYYVKKTHHDNINAVYIGRVDIYQKGFDILLEAINIKQKELRNSNFHLNVYGPDCGDAYSKIADLVERFKVNDLITIHDAVFGEDKHQILKLADLFVMTSRFEGLPMGLIESLSYGIPCLITKGTNLAEEVLKHDAGWVSENNATSVAIALQTMLNQKSSLTQKGENAFTLSYLFNWNTIASEMHNWLMEIINKPQ